MVKRIKVDDLSNTFQWGIIILIAVVIMLVVLQFYPMKNKDLDNVARWECHNESNRSEEDKCFERCYDIAYSDLNSTCNPTIKDDCEINQLKWEKEA